MWRNQAYRSHLAAFLYNLALILIIILAFANTIEGTPTRSLQANCTFSRVGEITPSVFIDLPVILHMDTMYRQKERLFQDIHEGLMKLHRSKNHSQNHFRQFEVILDQTEIRGIESRIEGHMKQLGAEMSHREQRSIALFVGSVLAVGTSLFSLAEVHHVKNIAISNKRHIDLNSHLISSMQASARRWRHQVSEEMDYREEIADIKESLHQMEAGIKNVVRGVNELRFGRVSTDLLDFEVLKDKLPGIEKELAAKGLELAYSYPQIFYAAGISYVLGDRKIVVFLHLVAKRQGEAALDLFRLEGVHLKGRHNRGVRLDGKQLLAVSKKADEHTAMDMSDLMKCLKVGHIYHCPDISILSRSVDTCVSAIYFKDLEAVGSTCGPLFRLVDERVMKVGTNSYLVNTPFPLTLNCNRTTTTLHVEPYAVVQVPPTCTAYNAQLHILIQPKAPTIQGKDVNIEFALPTRVLRGHNIYHQLEESNEKEELAEARRAQDELEADGWGLGTGYNWVVGVTTVILSAIVAGGLICCWRRCRGTDKAAQKCQLGTLVSGRLTASRAVFRTSPRPEVEDQRGANRDEDKEEGFHLAEVTPTEAPRQPPQKPARLLAGPLPDLKKETGPTGRVSNRAVIVSIGDDDVFFEDYVQTPAAQRKGI